MAIVDIDDMHHDMLNKHKNKRRLNNADLTRPIYNRTGKIKPKLDNRTVNKEEDPEIFKLEGV